MGSIENKQQVLDWIADGCEWSQGIMLYSVFGKNQALGKNIAGKQGSMLGKLIYELCKSVGLDYLKMKSMGQIPEVKTVVSRELKTVEQKGKNLKVVKYIIKDFKIGQMGVEQIIKEFEDDELDKIESRHVEQYPATIRRVIAEYAESFQERSKTHRIMTEMPEGNSQALKTKRCELFDIVKGLSTRLEQLYDIRTVYDQTGFVPTDDEIWPTPKVKAKTLLPDSPEELRKMKKNQQSANTKDQSMLDYQSEKQGEVKKPMPSGPKRMKLENRIKARLKMIEEIEYKLMKL